MIEAESDATLEYRIPIAGYGMGSRDYGEALTPIADAWHKGELEVGKQYIATIGPPASCNCKEDYGEDIDCSCSEMVDLILRKDNNGEGKEKV